MSQKCAIQAQRSRRHRVLSLFLLPLIATAGLARSADKLTVSTSPNAETTGADVAVTGNELHLTLEQAIETALSRNLGIAVQRYSREQARLGIQQALGIYDFGVSAGLSASHSESAAASELEGATVQKQDRQGVSLGLSRLLPTGGTGSLSWSNAKLKTNNTFYLLNPSYSSGFDLNFSQPLLRNFGRNATEFGIRVARLSSDQSKEVFAEQVIATIQAVENAYWSVVEANEQLKVAEESKRIAVQLHENNKIRVDVGTLAPLELVSSEAGIATREEDVIKARAAIGNAEDVLKTLLRVESGDAWAATVVPETAPEADYITTDLGEALNAALESRPELSVEQLAQKSRELEASYYGQATKPSLDLALSYGYNGLGSTFSKANDQITGADFPSWSAAVQFGYPIGNRAAKAQALQAKLRAEQGEVGVTQLEQQIRTEVRLAVRGLETARQELESAKVSVRLQTANLDAERKKFLNGLSTSFQILQVEEQLTSAKSREVQAVTGYRRAMVEYYRAIGKLLDQTGVEVSD